MNKKKYQIKKTIKTILRDTSDNKLNLKNYYSYKSLFEVDLYKYFELNNILNPINLGHWSEREFKKDNFEYKKVLIFNLDLNALQLETIINQFGFKIVTKNE